MDFSICVTFSGVNFYLFKMLVLVQKSSEGHLISIVHPQVELQRHYNSI